MSVQVKFIGICTHLDNVNGKHRVVLVHAEHGAYINTRSIPPHIPKLRVKSGDIISEPAGPIEGLKDLGIDGEWREWQLCGAELMMENPKGQSTEPEPSYGDVPKLSALTKQAPGLSAEVTVKGQAACYFDIEGGRMSSDSTEHGAIYAIWNEDSNERPVLRVTPFWNRDSITLIPLRDGAQIEITHTGKQQGDSPYDFLLHYCILNDVPGDAKVPDENQKLNMPKNPNDITMGCSNSGYP